MFDNLDYVLFVIPVSGTCIVLFDCRLNRYEKWPQSDSDSSCVNKNVCGNKGFYSI